MIDLGDDTNPLLPKSSPQPTNPLPSTRPVLALEDIDLSAIPEQKLFSERYEAKELIGLLHICLKRNNLAADLLYPPIGTNHHRTPAINDLLSFARLPEGWDHGLVDEKTFKKWWVNILEDTFAQIKEIREARNVSYDHDL